MSDEEDQVIGSEEEEEEEESGDEQSAPAKDSGPSEAQLAMEKRRQHQASLGANLDEVAQAVLETSRIERERLQEEIEEMKSRNEERKRIREEEEKALAEKRAEEDAQRKAAEEERGRKKQEEEMKRREMRAARLAAYEALSLPQGRNFVITKKDGGEEQEEELDEEELANKEKKSKEQQEQEKKAILSQRIKPVNMDELNSSDKLKEKARELHNQIVRLESEKYDLEKRFKAQQYDMMELAERARQMNKVGKGGLKRLQLKEDEVDKIQERYAGAPAKIEMYSRYERQKDKRTFSDRHVVFHGPTWKYPAKRIRACKIVKWDEDSGLPIYVEMEGADAAAAANAADEAEEREEEAEQVEE